MKAALENELRILRGMEHRNCLKLVGCFQDSLGYYILTELLDENRSLQQEMVKFKGSPNPPSQLRAIKHIMRSLL